MRKQQRGAAAGAWSRAGRRQHFDWLVLFYVTALRGAQGQLGISPIAKHWCIFWGPAK